MTNPTAGAACLALAGLDVLDAVAAADALPEPPGGGRGVPR